MIQFGSKIQNKIKGKVILIMGTIKIVGNQNDNKKEEIKQRNKKILITGGCTIALAAIILIFIVVFAKPKDTQVANNENINNEQESIEQQNYENVKNIYENNSIPYSYDDYKKDVESESNGEKPTSEAASVMEVENKEVATQVDVVTGINTDSDDDYKKDVESESNGEKPTSEAASVMEKKNNEVATQVSAITGVDADPEKVKSDIMDQINAVYDYISDYAGYPEDEYPTKDYLSVLKYNYSLIKCLFGDDSKFVNAYEGFYTKDQQVNRLRYQTFNLIPYSIANSSIEYTDVYKQWFLENKAWFTAISSISLSSPSLEGRESKVFDGHFADLEATIYGYDPGEHSEWEGTYLVYLSSEKNSDGTVSRYRILDIIEQ
jgi:hypothetical protein